MSEHEVLTKSQVRPEIEAIGRSRSPRWMRFLGYAIGAAVTIGLVALAFWLVTTLRGNPAAENTSQPENPTAPAAPAVPAALQRPVVSDAELAEKVGVRIVQVAVTGGGGLIDLRFQATDPDKAGSIHDQSTPPTLIDDKTGVVVNQLLMGHSHTEGFKAGQTYYLIFENPGNLVQRGSTVSVLLGNAQVDHVTVQ